MAQLKNIKGTTISDCSKVGLSGWRTGRAFSRTSMSISIHLCLFQYIYVYFNNDQHGYAVTNAQTLRGFLGRNLSRAAQYLPRFVMDSHTATRVQNYRFRWIASLGTGIYAANGSERTRK
jgi:hypothetical protein